MADDLQIRPYREHDEHAVIALWHASELTRPWNDPRRDISRKLAVSPEWFLVAVVAGRVLGSVMAGYDCHRGWLNDLAVDPTVRGRGLGRTLMARAEQLLRNAVCPRLNLQIRTDNVDVQAFYERIGDHRDDVVSYGRRLITDEEPGSS